MKTHKQWKSNFQRNSSGPHGQTTVYRWVLQGHLTYLPNVPQNCTLKNYNSSTSIFFPHLMEYRLYWIIFILFTRGVQVKPGFDMTFLMNENKSDQSDGHLQKTSSTVRWWDSTTFELWKSFKEGCMSENGDLVRGGSEPPAVFPTNFQRVERLIHENWQITCHICLWEHNHSQTSLAQ